MNIVFAGTAEFTLPCLNALIASTHQIIGVYTQPDRPAGRGRKLQPSAVKQLANAHDLALYQPENFKTQESIATLANLNPDIMVVIAYGLILPPAILAIPKFGCINVHASLLPRWRGASPIQQAILHGDSTTGVTIIQMNAGLDTGAMLASLDCPIFPEDTASSLQDRLAQLAVNPLLTTLDNVALGKLTPKAQDEHHATYAGKIKKEDASINWQQSAIEINNQIRAFNPWPIAYTTIANQTLRIYQAEVVAQDVAVAPGTIIALDSQGMLVATGNYALLVKTIQFPGGKVLSVANYLHANRNVLQLNLVLR